ncbi:T9SS type A sorting domain-containing protein [Hymenobacter persicinus]|uniref:T9SS type A sorting domain-containing protein n=1 Tax=Hymenobacter persicinus TaxID=2025506 RepID=A0A4Q5LAR6_9BACT|nr:T9SS type A sorting domain-containing protein [Hymenobacter persicinus]RYU78783.1 T9SS type A sorting domain-containing protein [Hymenobacter persicinus]
MKHVVLSLGLLLSALTGRAQVSNTFYGALTATDPTITGNRLNRDGTSAVCGTNKTYPGVLANSAGVHYDTFTLTNPSTTTSACATITLTPLCSEGTAGYIFASVYSTAFDKANLATNYRSDMGASPTMSPLSMGVTISPREVLVVVVSGVTAASTCSSYGLTISAPVALGVRDSRVAAPALVAYPNPVEDVLHLAAPKPGSYTLYSATGEVVKQFSGAEVSLRGLAGGVYMLQHDETKAATRVVKL